MESRVLELERQVADLRETVAAQTERIGHLTDAVKELRETLKPISETVTRGKGFLSALMLAAGVVGALVDMLVRKWWLS